jgi:hypothetical protein
VRTAEIDLTPWARTATGCPSAARFHTCRHAALTYLATSDLASRQYVVGADDLDQSLLDHLVVEFLDHGQRAVDFLRSAQTLLSAPPEDAPRLPDMIAYCLREAMKAITASRGTSGGGLWRTTSRTVVDARKRFELTRGLPGEDSDAALRNLLATIDEMALQHDDETIHQRRLIAVIVNRTGAQPLAAGVEPVRAYQQVLTQLDEAVHRGINLDGVKRLWTECMGLLRQLFLPPEVRNSELDELAALVTPGPEDVSKLVTLMAAPNHLHYFLSRLQTPAWLELLMSNTSLLVPPTGQAPWPVFVAVKALREKHAAAIANVLLQMLDRWGDNPQQAMNVARAAADLAEHGESVLLQALRRHKTLGISTLAIFAAGKDYAAESFVYEVADIVLNPSTWSESVLYVDPLLKAMVKGLDAANSTARITLLCFKVRRFQGTTRQVPFYIEYSESLEDFPDYLQREPFYALMRTLVESLRKAFGWADRGQLLQVVSELPEDLRGRIRTWILANASSVEGESLIQEVTKAIGSRRPSADDVRVLSRAMAQCDAYDYQETWTRALGTPPTIAELGAGLASSDVPASWRHAFLWSAVLPPAVAESWAPTIAIMSGAYGPPAPPSIEPSTFVEPVRSQSPISENELRGTPVSEAAQRIAAWRPTPGQVMLTALELARTLEAVVKSDPATWGATPLLTASLLRQPTYIHHYLGGLANAQSLQGVPVAELIDLMVLVRTRPWPAVPLGEDPFDYDRDWRPAEHTTIEVIKRMAVLDAGFNDRRDEVWAILRTEIEDRTEPPDISGERLDPLDRAINRPCTRALDAALSFLAHEHRLNGIVRPDALGLLASTLQVEGADGAEYRAILATRIGFLRYIAPHWVEQFRDEFFGDAASDGLGQVTVDLALRWGQPNRWLLENYQAAVKDAITRGVRNSRDHYLVAMLWRVPGYAVPDAVGSFAAKELLSAAGRTLARLLSTDDINSDVLELAVEFWKLALKAKPAGSLAGFGWFADVSIMEAETWLDLTLQTLTTSTDGLDWPDKVAERTAAGTPTTKTGCDSLKWPQLKGK